MKDINSKYDLMTEKQTVGDDLSDAFKTFTFSFGAGRYGTMGRNYATMIHYLNSKFQSMNLSEQEKRNFDLKNKEPD